MRMTKAFPTNRFNLLIDSTYKAIRELSTIKGGEYSDDDDRLANFRRNGFALGLPMESVWAVYAAKHWDAIMQFVHDINKGKQRPRLESLEGRCDDLMVYLLLFKAMLAEREDSTAPRGYSDDLLRNKANEDALKSFCEQTEVLQLIGTTLP